MKVVLRLAPLLLGGCVHEVALWGKCSADTSQGLIGQPWSKKMEDRVRSRSHAFKVRVVRPGEMVTMDFVENRMTVTLDERNHVVKIACG